MASIITKSYIKVSSPESIAQANEIAEWNAKIERKHHDRSTKHNTKSTSKSNGVHKNANTSKTS